MSIWDEFKQKEEEDSLYYSFNEIGASAEGIILDIGVVTFGSGAQATTKPQLKLKTPSGKEKFLTVGSADLRRQVVNIAPAVGDHIAVRLVRKEGDGDLAKKFFEVKVTPGTLMANGTQPAPAPDPTPATTAAAVDPF